MWLAELSIYLQCFLHCYNYLTLCNQTMIQWDTHRLWKLVKLVQNSTLGFHFKLTSIVQLTHHPYQRECLTFVNLVL